MALDLRDDPALIARYKKEHAQAWPAVLARLREIGVTEMKIFLLGRRMFMYCETRDGFDPAIDFARSTDDPAYRKSLTIRNEIRAIRIKNGDVLLTLER